MKSRSPFPSRRLATTAPGSRVPVSTAAAVASLATLAALGTLASPARAQQTSSGANATSLTLSQVVAMAKDRAPAVHAAFSQIASAEAGVDRSSAARLPSLYLQGAGNGFATNGQVYSSGVVSSASSETYITGSGALNLQWTLYDFGHTGNAVDAARAGVKAATLSARAVEQAAMAEAAVAFFTLLADDELIRSAEGVRVDRDHVLGVTRTLVDGGYRTKVDETRAKIGLQVAELDLSVAKAARDNDSVGLATALLLDPATAFHLVAPAALSVDEAAAGNGTVALRARRDVAAAEARVDQARLNVTSAKRAHLPVLAASASGQLLYAHGSQTYSAAGQSTSYPIDGPTELVQGAVTLTLPLFDSLVNANVHTAEASLGEAQAGLDQVTLAAKRDALQAARQARSARVLFEQSQRLAEGTAANLAIVEDRYASGMEDPLALADAQREDALARNAIVRARLAYDVAAVKLLAGLSRADELLNTK
jgi:multidrug efflux system outer membrane protein